MDKWHCHNNKHILCWLNDTERVLHDDIVWMTITVYCVCVAGNGNPGGKPAMYFATAADATGDFSHIYRPQLGQNYDFVRTIPRESKWLNSKYKFTFFFFC